MKGDMEDKHCTKRARGIVKNQTILQCNSILMKRLNKNEITNGRAREI